MTVYHSRIEVAMLAGRDDAWTVGFAHEYIGTATPTDDLGVLTTGLVNFFTTPGSGGTHAIRYYLGTNVNQGTNACSYKVYDVTGHLNGSPAGSPVAVGEWTMGATGIEPNLPTGSAAVLSWKANYGSDVEFAPGARPRSRDRNRCYIGALGGQCFDYEATTNSPKLTSAFRTDAMAALFDLADLGPGKWALRVWSRKNAGVKLVETIFMDDRIDYQRRRSDPSGVVSSIPGPSV